MTHKYTHFVPEFISKLNNDLLCYHLGELQDDRDELEELFDLNEILLEEFNDTKMDFLFAFNDAKTLDDHDFSEPMEIQISITTWTPNLTLGEAKTKLLQLLRLANNAIHTLEIEVKHRGIEINDDEDDDHDDEHEHDQEKEEHDYEPKDNN